MKFSELNTGDYFWYEGQAYMKIFTKHSITYNCVGIGGENAGVAHHRWKDDEVTPVERVAA